MLCGWIHAKSWIWSSETSKQNKHLTIRPEEKFVQFLVYICCFFKRILQHSPGWPHSNAPASVCWVPRVQICATTPCWGSFGVKLTHFIRSWVLRDGSAIKISYCSCRVPKFDPKPHNEWLTTTCSSTYKGHQKPPAATGTSTYSHTDICTYKNF